MENKTAHIPFRMDTQTVTLLNATALAKNMTRSDFIRECIERSLKADGYKNDDDRLFTMIKSALKELLDPAVTRLAAISAKNAQMAGANYVMLIYLARLILGDEAEAQIDEMGEQARLSGIEILKSKDARIDEVIKKAIKETKEYV